MLEEAHAAPQLERRHRCAAARIDAAAAMRRSARDCFRAPTAGEIGGWPSICDTPGMSAPFDLSERQASREAEATDLLTNPMGVVHGGFAATLLDSALGLAMRSALSAGVGYATADLKTGDTRAIPADGRRMRPAGRVVHVGRRMVAAEASLTGLDDGRLHAHGTATRFLFPLSGAEA